MYVKKKDRGEWETREEAEQMIVESWEIAIEVPNARNNQPPL
jgi:predicted RNase H-like HicB family nuclease